MIRVVDDSNMGHVKMSIAWYQAFINVLTVFGETEIGSSEPNYEAISNYMSTLDFFNDQFCAPKCRDAIEYFEEQLTQRILDGFPVWRFLKLSDWTMNMIEKSFLDECVAEKAAMKKKYCCLRCKFIRERGLGYSCNAPHMRYKLTPREFELKEKCRYFRRNWDDQ